MKNLLRNSLLFIVIMLIAGAILSMFQTSLKTTKEVGIGEIAQQIKSDQVASIDVSGERLQVTLKDGTKELSRKEPTDALSTILRNYDVSGEQLGKVAIAVKDTSSSQFWFNLLPFLIPFLFIAGFIWFTMRQVQGSNARALSFGQSQAREANHRDRRNRVTFKDVAGAYEAKDELKEVVDFLRNPLKYQSMGARIPKGVLLVGPPGTGKTLLAKAIAGEADVPFFHMSGSEFVEMFVGVGASRVRDLFRRAKKAAPDIVFIDEIDAVGRQRGAGLGGSHDEREQTLNQILVEMDGFETDTNVIIIAATNRPDVLDPALLRPGRFDRRIIIDLPDRKEREEILQVHAQKKPLASDVALRRIAERTPGFSGADLSNLLNEAAILAARRSKKIIGMTECLESIEKVMLGPERKSHVMNEREKKITAYHEAGHALVAHVLPHADPVHKISIISRGAAAGYTIKLPSEDKHLHAKAEFLDDLAVMVAGWTVEKEVFGDVTTGASSDLREATTLARQLVTQYGMSEKLGPRTFGDRDELIFLGREIHEERDYSEKVAQDIDREVTAFINGAHTTAKAIVTKLRPVLDRIVTALLEKETLEKDEFETIVQGVALPALKHLPAAA